MKEQPRRQSVLAAFREPSLCPQASTDTKPHPRQQRGQEYDILHTAKYLRGLRSSGCPCSTISVFNKNQMGFHHDGQAGLELLTSGDPPTSASQSARTTGVNHRARPLITHIVQGTHLKIHQYKVNTGTVTTNHAGSFGKASLDSTPLEGKNYVLCVLVCPASKPLPAIFCSQSVDSPAPRHRLPVLKGALERLSSSCSLLETLFTSMKMKARTVQILRRIIRLSFCSFNDRFLIASRVAQKGLPPIWSFKEMGGLGNMDGCPPFPLLLLLENPRAH
ncbi:hypothetical protein AAY473_001344 [Plecturocebus cupreus]